MKINIKVARDNPMQLRYMADEVYRNRLELYLRKLRFGLYKLLSRRKFLLETEPCNPPELIQKIQGDYRYVEIEINDDYCFEVFTRKSIFQDILQIIRQRRRDILDAIGIAAFILSLLTFLRGHQLKNCWKGQ